MPDDIIVPILREIQSDVAAIKRRLDAQGDELQMIALRLNTHSAMFKDIIDLLKRLHPER